MGISTGGNINISGSGNVVDLNVTGPAIFNTDIWVGGNIYNANLFSGKDGLFSGNLTVLGNLRYTNVSVVVTDNLQFRLANNQSNAQLLDGGGWTLGANNQGTFLYNNSSESWQTNLSLFPTANNTLNLGGPINHWNNLYVNNALMPGNLVAGNVSGTFAGDAGNLTNIPAANISGTVANANTVTNNNQPNITSLGTLTTLTVSGNVTASYFYGNLIGVISNAAYANSAGNALTAATVTSNLQPNINMVGTLTSLSVSGNAQTGNLLTNGYVSSQGNVTAAYLFGNGSQLTGVVTTLSGNLAGNISANGYYINNLPALSVNGNITGNYIFGNGSQLTGLPAGYANANAESYFASGNSTANISIQGNILTTDYISATGNVTGNYILGNGAFLTGVITTVSNISNGTSNVSIDAANADVTFGVNGTSNVVVVSSNSLSVNGTINGGNINITGVGNVANLSSSGQVTITAANIVLSTTGNIKVSNAVISNLGTPFWDEDATPKSYVDFAVGNLSPKTYVTVATTGPIANIANVTSVNYLSFPPPSNIARIDITSNNFISIDGANLAQLITVYGFDNARVLVKDEQFPATANSSAGWNGIYVVESAGNNFVSLRRAQDFNYANQMYAASVFVNTGNTNANTAWLNTNNILQTPIAVGGTPITFTQVIGNGVNINANNVTATGNISAGNIYIGNTILTRTLTVARATTPVTVPLSTNNSLNVLQISGSNVVVFTT